MLVAEYLRYWLEVYADRSVAPSTARRYRSIVEQHLIPTLGGARLSDLAAIDVQRAHEADLKSGLSGTTVLQHHAVLSKALKQAVRWDMIPRNPCEMIDRPRKSRRTMKPLDDHQVPALLEAAAGTLYYEPIYVGVNTGLRRSELLGLKWEDVDLQLARLSVTRTLEYVYREYSYREVKTAYSRRSIALAPATALMLRGLQRESEPVFVDDEGEIIKPHRLTDAVPRLCREAGLPVVRFHDLRHTHASLLLKSGVNPKVVSERLGHSSVAFTLDTYGHVMPGMQEEAAARFESLVTIP